MQRFLTILDRYLITELAGSWLIGLAVFIGFLLAGEVLGKGIELVFLLKAPLMDAFRWFLLAIPNLISLSLPMSTLLAVVMTLGRMSRDHEIVAIQALGIPFQRLMIPIATLSLTISFLAFWLNAFIVPPTYGASDAILWRYRSLGQGAMALRIIYPPKGPPRLILNANRFHPSSGLMEGVDLWEAVTEKGEWRYLRATKGHWSNDRWEFFSGSVQIIVPDKPSLPAPFEKMSLQAPIPMPSEVTDVRAFNPNRLNLIALTVQISELKRWKMPDEYVREYAVEWHNRFSLPLSCFVLSLIGAPVALHLRRGGGLAVGVSVVLVLTYFILWKVGGMLGQSGALLPGLGSHLPNLIGLGAVAAWLRYGQ